MSATTTATEPMTDQQTERFRALYRAAIDLQEQASKLYGVAADLEHDARQLDQKATQLKRAALSFARDFVPDEADAEF